MADAKIRVTADTAQAERQLEQLSRALNDVSKTTAAATKALAAITAAGAAMGFVVKKSLDSIDELAKASRRLGMSAADLQAFRNSAELAGVSSDELTASLGKLQINIGNALTKGTGPAKDALDRLGISMDQLKGVGADKQFEIIAAELNKIPDPAQRSAMAVELLGKQGPRLLEASEHTQRFKEEAKKLGLELSKIDTAAAERANDAMSELSMISKGIGKRLSVELAPIIIVIADRIKLAVMEMGGLDTIIRQRVIPAFKLAGQVAAALMGYIAAVKIIAVAAAFGRLAVQVVAVARAMRTLGVAAAAAKAIATGGLSAIVTMTAGVAGAIAAATAAGRAMDGIFKEAEGVTAEIAANAKDVKDNVDGTVGPAMEVNKAYTDTLAKLRENVVYQQEILTVGQEEASIRKLIREEQEKYAGASADVLRNLSDQEKSLKEQIKLKEQLNKTDEEIEELLQKRLVKEGLAFKELQDMHKKFEDQRQRYQKATTDEQRRQINQQTHKLNQEYDKRLADLMVAHSREESAIENFNTKIEQINTLQREATLAGFGEESKRYRSLTEEKARLEQELNDKKRRINEDRIRSVLQMEMRAMQKQRQFNSVKIKDADREELRRIGQEEKMLAMVDERIKFEKKSTTEQRMWAVDQAAQMFSALGAQNKKAFEAAKAFNLANAIMNTYMAATKALATYPPPFNFIAAAAAIGMGLAQVAQIRSQQYSGRRLGGPVMGGQSYVVGEAGPEIFTPNSTGSITRNRDSFAQGGPVNVNFTINAVDSAGVDALLVQRRGLITQIINDAMVERGQRGI